VLKDRLCSFEREFHARSSDGELLLSMEKGVLSGTWALGVRCLEMRERRSRGEASLAGEEEEEEEEVEKAEDCWCSGAGWVQEWNRHSGGGRRVNDAVSGWKWRECRCAPLSLVDLVVVPCSCAGGVVVVVVVYVEAWDEIDLLIDVGDCGVFPLLHHHQPSGRFGLCLVNAPLNIVSAVRHDMIVMGGAKGAERSVWRWWQDGQ